MLLKPRERLSKSLRVQAQRLLERPLNIGIPVSDLDRAVATHKNQELPISGPSNFARTHVCPHHRILNLER